MSTVHFTDTLLDPDPNPPLGPSQRLTDTLDLSESSEETTSLRHFTPIQVEGLTGTHYGFRERMTSSRGPPPVQGGYGR